MKLRFLLVLAPACALGLTACDKIRIPGKDQPAVHAPASSGPSSDTSSSSGNDGTAQAAAEDYPVRPQAMASTATIDWAAARADVAAQAGVGGGVSTFEIASGEEAPPVPVMLPSLDELHIQSGESGVKFQPLSDGYFAVYPGADYNIVVNGTNEVIGERTDAGDTSMRFSPTTTGAQVAFTKYGADYLVEFECTNASGENPECISEEDAMSIAGSLVPVRSR